MFTQSFFRDFIDHTQHMSPRVYVVSEKTLEDMQGQQKERTLRTIDDRIEDLQTYRKTVEDMYTTPKLEDKST